MARALALLSLLAVLFVFAGCGDKQARVALRNSVEAAKYIQEASSDPAVRAAGAAIEAQATASADQMDLVLWGLWESRSRATIPKEDWVEAPESSLRRSNDQARAVEAETAQMRAWSGTFMDSIGLASGLTGSGMIGLLLAGVLKYRKELLAAKDDLFTSVVYAKKVEAAETDDDVEAIKKDFVPLAGPHLKEALAKRKTSAKLS